MLPRQNSTFVINDSSDCIILEGSGSYSCLEFDFFLGGGGGGNKILVLIKALLNR